MFPLAPPTAMREYFLQRIYVFRERHAVPAIVSVIWAAVLAPAVEAVVARPRMLHAIPIVDPMFRIAFALVIFTLVQAGWSTWLAQRGQVVVHCDGQAADGRPVEWVEPVAHRETG